jgi:[acyl-carrier-protein] S-malonyltransferase
MLISRIPFVPRVYVGRARFCVQQFSAGMRNTPAQRKVLLFSGQGTQFPGMGKTLYDNFDVAKSVFEEADENLGWKLSEIMFEESNSKKLALTGMAQPSILVYSLAVFETFKKLTGTRTQDFSVAAGHSLGEYTALVASESISFRQGLNLVRLRGKLMQECVPKSLQFSMVALMPSRYDEILEIINIVKGNEDDPKYFCCDVANHNSSSQVVLSGIQNSVKKVIAKAKDMGKLRRAVPLTVSAPFHSKLMLPAQYALQSALEEVELRRPLIPIVSNADATVRTDPIILKDRLVQQTSSTVHWYKTMELFRKSGFKTYHEFGAKPVLAPFVPNHFKGVQVSSITGLKSLRNSAQYFEISTG